VGPTLTRQPVVVRSFVVLAQWLGWMAPGIDVAAFRDVAEDWTRLDLDAYARIFEAISAHDASDLLATIATPTLVVAGGADLLTPPALSKEMAAAMPDARLELVEGATHFSLLEHGDEIVDVVERFVDTLARDAGKRRHSPYKQRGGRPRSLGADDAGRSRRRQPAQAPVAACPPTNASQHE
jgi:pimeloyl-ACP methyl ester carboxylesterase